MIPDEWEKKLAVKPGKKGEEMYLGNRAEKVEKKSDIY